jgi:mono/diheme cytochrome c family protein
MNMLSRALRALGLALIPAVLLVYAAPAPAADAAAGKALYEEHCLKCHGEKGKGDGATAKKLKMKMADYSDAAAMAKFTDAELAKITADGGAAHGKSKLMPAYKDKLNEQQVADVIAYIRSFSKK